MKGIFSEWSLLKKKSQRLLALPLSPFILSQLLSSGGLLYQRCFLIMNIEILWVSYWTEGFFYERCFHWMKFIKEEKLESACLASILFILSYRLFQKMVTNLLLYKVNGLVFFQVLFRDAGRSLNWLGTILYVGCYLSLAWRKTAKHIHPVILNPYVTGTNNYESCFIF